jgi:hypothetical protein
MELTSSSAHAIFFKVDGLSELPDLDRRMSMMGSPMLGKGGSGDGGVWYFGYSIVRAHLLNGLLLGVAKVQLAHGIILPWRASPVGVWPEEEAVEGSGVEQWSDLRN